MSVKSVSMYSVIASMMITIEQNFPDYYDDDGNKRSHSISSIEEVELVDKEYFSIAKHDQWGNVGEEGEYFGEHGRFRGKAMVFTHEGIKIDYAVLKTTGAYSRPYKLVYCVREAYYGVA